ncbi:MAG: amino acid adenylation domain-containing protein, partial [Planctomycetaceae bacterium]
GGLAIAEEPLEQTTARFDLLWNLTETAGGELRGSLEYADDLFDRETISLLVSRFVHVLHEIMADWDRTVSELDVLLDGEYRQLLEWGRGPRPADTPLGILESFARRVAEQPDALAVRDDRQSLTYAELATRIDQWAAALSNFGVGPEAIVAIRLGRSVDFVVAMLATLRAGGAYLPLEEQTPEARLRQILESADPALLLTTRVLGEQVGWRATEFVDEWAPVVAAELRTNWPIATDAQAAYCIHTSGSTGRPKGIVGLHGTLRNLIAWQEPTPRPIRVAQFTAVGFDVSPQEILTALLTGGSLHVVDEPTRLDPELFVDFLIRERITDLFVPFIVLENLASAAEDLGRTIPELREVHQAGEALRLTPLIRQFFTRHPDCRLHNHYGPAETHVVTACTLPADPSDWPEQVTIGGPIQGMQAYVLDERMRLMPPGAIGELCFSGVGVNRGYLNSPVETAAKFVHDPWSERTGERLYRTGDLGRWRRDGTLDFLGRIDQQVKIRGVRVEPAEIERAILDQGGATQAAVVPWTGQRGETLLAAYVVPREGRPMDMSALRQHLASVLPAAMIPAAMIAVAQIPLTVNGKLDRSRLPTPQEDPAEEASRPPTTTTQQRLAGMFGEILSQNPVGIDDCFFRLGGHSLLATRLASRIRRELGVELPIRVVFEQPTVAGLAEWIESQSGNALVVRPRLTRETRPVRLPLSAAQQRMWFLRQFETAAATYHIPLARRVTGPLDVDALRLAVRDLLERHESLRTVFPVEEGEPWQRILPVDPLSVPLDVVPATMASLAAQLQEASIRPFDLACELPIRVTLFVVGPNEQVLLIVLHHIAADGTSLTPLWRDLSMAYAARNQGAAPGWNPLPVQYADYTLWQQRWLGSSENPASVASRELGFWREALAGLPEELTLPTDRPRPRVASYRGGTVPIAVGAELLSR